MVYRDGLENRYGLTAIGGSNPSPSARKNVNKSNINLVVIAVLVAVAFGFSWRKGYLLRLRNYVLETREELRKCTWPSWDELKGSTVVVFISIIILGGFTVLVDQIFFRLFYLLKL